MQPERRRGKAQEGLSRARILLKKNLGWLPGFPLSNEGGPVRWWCLHLAATTDADISIGREQLQRMEMTLTRLRHRFPRALPKIVEDVDDWLGRMDHLLAILKVAIHYQREIEMESWLSEDILPRRWTERFSEIWNRHKPLQPLLRAILFLETTGVKRPSVDAIDWLDTHAESLRGLTADGASGSGKNSLELQLLFFILRGEMHPELQSTLFECLADESIWWLSSDDVCRRANQLSDQLKCAADKKPFQIPEPSQRAGIGNALFRLLRELSSLKPKPRRHVTQLLSLLISSSFRDRVRALRSKVESEESRLLGMLHRVRCETSKQPRRKAERKRLMQVANVAVDDASQRFVANVMYATKHVPTVSQSDSLIGIWIRFLNHLPMLNVELRVGLFARWEQMRVRHHNGEQATREFLHTLGQLCALFSRRRVNPALLSHWEHFSQSDQVDGEFVQELIDEANSREICTRTVQLLEEVLYERGASPSASLICSLVEFVKATSDRHRAARVVSALALHKDQYQCYENREIRAALAVADDDAAVANIVRALDDDFELIEPVILLGSRVRETRLRRIVERSALNSDKKLLRRLAACTQLVEDLGFSLPEVPDLDVSTVWSDRYPVALHQVLRQLSRVTEDAQRIADSLLSKDFPEEAELREELAVLREKLLQADNEEARQHLGKRLENLEQRIQVPSSVGPRRLANLTNRVKGRVDHEIIARYLQDGSDLVTKWFRSSYGVSGWPEELFRPPFDELLAGILQLKQGTKKLGLRLLLHHFCNTASGFSAEPKNVAFRKRLEAKGINMEPWLNDTFDLTAKMRNNETYRLFFTRRILDYLMMGFHFDTCLAPGSCNFFSTIANAVDLNKQVVYGKTDSGRVVGRCLFTLTDQGTILTYHRYTHDPADGFVVAVDRFAHQLAEAMNTRLATSGQVPTLVASDWYDDGAVRAESALDLLSADGVVRTLLRTADPKSVIDELREFVGTHQALKSALGSLLFLDEFTERPAIIPAFVRTFAFDRDLSFNERFRLAILARTAGLTKSADEIVASLRPNYLPIRLKRADCGYCSAFHGIGSYREVFDLLVDHNPTLALRTIRATRPRDVSQDADERDSHRRRALVRIHRLLGRNHLANQLACKQPRT